MEVDVIVIGTGFGAAVAVTTLLEKRPNATIHMLERGLWWFTPERPLPHWLEEQNKKTRRSSRSSTGRGPTITAGSPTCSPSCGATTP